MPTHRIDTNDYGKGYYKSLTDFKSGLSYYRVWGYLSFQDIKQRYRRSVIGPLWITISNAIVIAMLSFLYGALFGQPLEVYAPFLASGMLVWAFISVTINESTNLFFDNRNIIQQVNYPLSFYVYRLIARNVIILAHNFLIMPIIYYFFEITLDLFDIFFILLGVSILSVSLFLICLCFAILCTRYRDIQPLITNVVQAVFFVSPIMWLPVVLEYKGVATWLLIVNPLYYILDMVRSPMLGQSPAVESVLLCCSFLVFLFIVTVFILAKTKPKVVYWI